MVGRAGLDRRAQVVGGRGPGTSSSRPDRVEGVRVAVADAGQAVLVGEAHDPIVPRPAEARGVERLERVGAGPRRPGRRAGGGASSPGAQRVRHERVGGDGEAARLVDGRRSSSERAVRPDRPVDEQRQQVAAEGRHLLADDDLDAAARGRARSPAGDGGVDPLVVGDGDDVEVACALDVLEDGDDVRRPVGGERVDVQVGATRARGRSCAPGGSRRGRGGRLRRRAASRSGQIGKNTAHHCSGASATRSSKARAIRRSSPTRSRRALGGHVDRFRGARGTDPGRPAAPTT